MVNAEGLAFSRHLSSAIHVDGAVREAVNKAPFTTPSDGAFPPVHSSTTQQSDNRQITEVPDKSWLDSFASLDTSHSVGFATPGGRGDRSHMRRMNAEGATSSQHLGSAKHFDGDGRVAVHKARFPAPPDGASPSVHSSPIDQSMCESSMKRLSHGHYGNIDGPLSSVNATFDVDPASQTVGINERQPSLGAGESVAWRSLDVEGNTLTTELKGRGNGVPKGSYLSNSRSSKVVGAKRDGGPRDSAKVSNTGVWVSSVVLVFSYSILTR